MEQVIADPAIVRVVGDVGRPERGYDKAPDTSHIPGKDGLFAGLSGLVGWLRQGHAYVQAQAQVWGPIYRGQIGSHKFVFVNDPALATEVLRNRDKTWSAALGWLVQVGGMVEGPMDSPVTLDFGHHRDVRTLLQPAFAGEALESYAEMAAPIFEAAVDEWIAAGSVCFKPAVRELFARVSAKVFMGVDDPNEAARLDQWMSDFWAGSLALSKKAWLSPTWRRARRAYGELFAHFRAQVGARRKGEAPDLFGRLCRTNERVDWLDDDALVRMFLAVMSAAFDTTSAAVTSMAYLLATHPVWQGRLRDEAGTVSADRVTYRDTKKLALHDLVWKETLRYYPVAPSVPRCALRDTELGGHRIPAGTVLGVVLSAALRDPSCWTESDRFDPERFNAERNEGKKSGAYMPFGGGAHACIGAQLSALEAKAFWHAFLSSARFQLARPYKARHEFRPIGVVSGDVKLTVEAVVGSRRPTFSGLKGAELSSSSSC